MRLIFLCTLRARGLLNGLLDCRWVQVEGLRAELVAAKKTDDAEDGEEALIKYIQALSKEDQMELTGEVSAEVLEAMSQLVATILIDLVRVPLARALAGADAEWVC